MKPQNPVPSTRSIQPKRKAIRGLASGLATVLEVVTAHGGNITLDTAIGAGTTFSIVLPLGKQFSQNTALPSATRQIIPTRNAINAKKTGFVLLVEDEVILGRSTSRLLEQVGHTVHSVSSGAEAVKWYESNMDKPDLVLLDMNMPGMSGADTYRALRTLNPRCFGMVYSGYWTPEEEEQLRAEGILDFIQKPFDARQAQRSSLGCLEKYPKPKRCRDARQRSLSLIPLKTQMPHCNVSDTMRRLWRVTCAEFFVYS